MGEKEENTNRLLGELKRLAEAGKTGDFDITLNSEGLYGEGTEIIRLVNETVSNYRVAAEDEKKRTEDQLLMLSSIVQNSPNYASYNKFNGECIYANPAVSAITGYTQTELMNDYLGILFDDETVKYILTKVPEVLLEKGIMQYDVNAKMKNGAVKLFAMTSFIVDKDAYATIAADITELVQAQESLRQREKMLRTLNRAAIMFLAQQERTFEDMMTAGLGLIADELKLDRIGVYRNFAKPDGLHTSQIYRWDRELGGTTITTDVLRDVLYATLVPRWEWFLEAGGTINSPVSLLPEAATLKSFGCISAFVAPLFMENNFWGFILFEDRKIERFFDDNSTEIMRSAAYLCANTIIMYDMIQHQRQEGKRLEDLVDMRTKYLNRQNSLMSSVNAAATVLLEPDTGGALSAINRSMEIVCQDMDVDRVYLWQNISKDDGKLYYRRVYKWINPKYAIDNNLYEFAYEGKLPFWRNLVSEGKSLNGPVDTFPQDEREFFSSFDVQSILVIPLYLKGELWGLVSFDDCHGRRFFPEADEYALRSWGLLALGAYQRSEIMHDLKDAMEKAKKASREAKNASEAKSRFIANMNHEMRTPMNVIVGLTDLLLEEDVVPDSIKETMRKISTAGNTLMALIKDVLDISKIEAGKQELNPVQYDVASLLNDIITLNMIRIEEKPITFKLDIEEGFPCILFGDDLRVKQILNNLLSNAFKYTDKGTVTLGADYQREGDYIRVSFYVSDTGMGIRKKDISKLFTDYNQVDTSANRKIEGTGLGLSIAKKIAEMMDGKIAVESEYGKGTTFRVQIRQGFVTDRPISKETLENLNSFRYTDKKKQAQEKLVRADLRYARVLVVDDFSANLDVAAGMLRKYKMQVDCLTSGREAVDRIAAGESVYNAIFMDHMMPGMDGVEATVKIRSLGTKYAKNIPIIALTANAVAGNEQMFLDNGFNAFLPKPFNAMDLDSIVQRWVKDTSREKLTMNIAKAGDK